MGLTRGAVSDKYVFLELLVSIPDYIRGARDLAAGMRTRRIFYGDSGYIDAMRKVEFIANICYC